MAKNVRIVMNRKGVGQLLRTPEVFDLQSRCQNIAKAAGPGHETEVFVGKRRARGTVRTETEEARVAEATRHTLTRAIDAGRE